MEASGLNTINDLVIAFIVISPTVFIFAVTLLGNAIEQAAQEENAARENDKTSIQKEIEQAVTRRGNRFNNNMSNAAGVRCLTPAVLDQQ